jgi:cell division septum initiation protein DivIVA
MTVYEVLDLLIAELNQLRADNRRLKLALKQLRADNSRLTTSNSPPRAASVTASR